jgi:hypothetical protein
MRISKLLSAVCATAFLACALAVRAQDTPDQAAARAALMDKMNELNAQQSQPTNAPSAQTQTAPAVTAVPETTPPPVAAPAPPPVVVVTASGTVQEPAGQPTNVVPVPPPAAAPVAPSDNSSLFTPVPPPSNPVSQAAASPATPPPDLVPMPPAKPAAPAVKPAPANVSYAGKSLGFKPVEAPPPPVSAQKEAELQALLARYMANQVSPDEYQKERAAILAEP